MTPDLESRARAWLALSPADALALNRSHGLGAIERVAAYYARHVDRPGPGVDIDACHYRLGAVTPNTDSAGRAYWVGKPGESLPHDRAVTEERLAGCDAGQSSSGA